MLIIRKALENDVALLTKLGYDTFHETYAAYNTQSDMDMYLSEKFTQDRIATELQQDGADFFIAELSGKPAGYVKYNMNNNNPENLIANRPLELERIYILKEYQRSKIGKELIHHCISYARENLCDVIWLIVWQENLQALKFYESHGFIKFGVKDFILGNDVQKDYLMKLQVK